MSKYRKVLVAVYGVFLLALRLLFDGGWSEQDTITIAEAIGVAAGVYGVTNEKASKYDPKHLAEESVDPTYD